VSQLGAALHWCWVTAHLFEEQIFTGVHRVLSNVDLHSSSTGAEGMHRILSNDDLQPCWAPADLCTVQSRVGLLAASEKAVPNLCCRAALVRRACAGF